VPDHGGPSRLAEGRDREMVANHQGSRDQGAVSCETSLASLNLTESGN
jgi:hypothetical protein